MTSDRDRDRDPTGRPRNARPRDELGRPLPRGAADIPRAPEGLLRTAAETLDEAQRLLDLHRPFHAHEVFEDAWKATPSADREVWRGLAQLAVGLTHAARGNPVGASSLLRRGAKTITPFREAPPHGIDVDGLIAWARAAADDPESVTSPTLRRAHMNSD